MATTVHRLSQALESQQVGGTAAAQNKHSQSALVSPAMCKAGQARAGLNRHVPCDLTARRHTVLPGDRRVLNCVEAACRRKPEEAGGAAGGRRRVREEEGGLSRVNDSTVATGSHRQASAG
jgi:hypothetical protein